jgi:PAS domain S-box-containing protein
LTEPTTVQGRSTRSVRVALGRARLEVPEWGRLHAGRDRRVGVGVGIGIAALLLKAVANTMVGGDTGFVILFAAVVIAAWVGGFAGGLSASIVSGLGNLLVFIGPNASPNATPFELTPLDLARFGLYVLAASGVTALIASVGTSRDRMVESLAAVAAMADDIERRDERLELVLAASGLGFWDWDVRTGELLWSEAIFTQHGLVPEDGAPTFERYMQTVHPDDRAALQASLDDAVAHGTSFSHEFRVIWPDGSVHSTHGVGRVFRNAAGEPIRMVGTGQDITERRRVEEERDRLLEEERRAGTFREAFVDVISHELRTPITTIFGLTRILGRPNRQTTADEQAELISDISAEAERLHRLVEDLLVLTRAERGAIAIESEPLEPRRLLNRIIAREAARLPSLTIEAELAGELPIVAGEDTYVEQIVRNMLSNAAKYTPIGTRVVVRAEQEGENVAIRILDSGPGIDEASVERAFELFYRDPTLARSIAGSGIGLFVCASLVKAMGGTIWARRRLEGGSEFGFTLRVIPDDEAALTTTSQASA